MSLKKKYSKLFNILNKIELKSFQFFNISQKIRKKNRKATISKSYRVVSLLNCMGKIAEKIIATRLSYIVETSDLLDSDQISDRRQKSAIDAVMTLIHDIQLVKHENRVTSVLFMNIKEAYDHVSVNHLLKICQKLKLSKSFCF